MVATIILLGLLLAASVLLNGVLYSRIRALTSAMTALATKQKLAASRMVLPVPGETHEGRTRRIVQGGGQSDR